MEHSKYQKDIFAAIEKQNGHLVIEAAAGSGKTTTLLESMKIAKGNCIFVAFSKTIATELASRVPSHVQACTLHSFGFAAIRKGFGGYIKADNKKLSFIMQKYPATMFTQSMTGKEKAQVFQVRQQITDLISIWKSTLIDYNNNEEVTKTANYYGINYDPSILGAARSIMEKSMAIKNFVDFDDMIYMPVALGLPIQTFDTVFVDECQDLNRSQIEMVLKMVKKPNGRVVAVGDSRQSIFGFRGADVQAMSRVTEALNATVMPLSVCYRCPTSHLDLAREIVPTIENRPEAPKGEIENITVDAFTTKVDKEKEPLVLCRTNAPLISYAIKLIKEGKKAHVRGADIGNFLRGLVIGFNTYSIAEFNNKVDEWENAQLEQLEKRRASNAVKETIIDYADVLREFGKQCTNPFDIVKMIDLIFSDATDGTVFSSVHRAKGLEADTVYIIRPDQLPLVRKDQQEWEVEQELNLKYVALTRSKNRLVFVNAE